MTSQTMRASYLGGRTECFKSVHRKVASLSLRRAGLRATVRDRRRVESVAYYDVSSSYPESMLRGHS